jgi:hypothetical protein
MTTTVMSPDERAIRQHLDSARFQAGVAAGTWHLVSVKWPIVMVGIAAAPRDGAPEEFALRLDVAGYPHSAPTGTVWDPDANAILAPDRRPRGDRASQIFRRDGWEQGRAMYAPWDRVALQGHPGWAQQYPHSVWNAQRDLTFVLANVSEVMNADDYLGI